MVIVVGVDVRASAYAAANADCVKVSVVSSVPFTPIAASVGATVSRVTVVPSAAVAGPVLAPSVAPLTAKRGITVPSVQPVTVTVRVAPESVPGLKTQPAAVPALEKSAAATPVTFLENVSV